MAIGYYVFFILPEASIEITLQQKPMSYHDTLLASLTDQKMPLQVFSETKNIQMNFPASGRKNVSRRAHGTINVCNAFNRAVVKLPDEPKPVPEGISAILVISRCGASTLT